jgi:sRNA-binding regulator protein Hfq
MPFSNRPHDTDSRHPSERRPFRSLPDFKRFARNGNGNGNGRNNRPAPPEATNAENFYYLKQMSSRTPMVIVMTDGEQIRGCIEWYDRTSLKVNRDGAPNLLIQKHCIKYLFKEDELE